MIGAQQGAEIKPQLVRLDDLLIRAALWHPAARNRMEFRGRCARSIRRPRRRSKSKRPRRSRNTPSSALIPSSALAKAVQNRLVESGRWPGLDKALEEAEAAGKLASQGGGRGKKRRGTGARARGERQPTGSRQAEALAKRGTVTRDQAIALIADAAPRPLYVHRKLLNGAEFIAWAKKAGFEPTTPADELHVTIAYSRAAVDWIKAGGELWGSDDDDLCIAPGGPRLVEPLGDTVVLLFASPRLSWRHEDIKREAGAASDYDDYQPHVTITYKKPDGLDLRTVEPYRGALEFGPEIFEEITDNWSGNVDEV